MTPYDDITPPGPAPLIDGFGRTVTYLRLSVTDRCDLRCVYCMAEHMTFLPKAEVLTLEELDRIATAFVRLGAKKLRLTGGEPLVRKGMMDLVGEPRPAPEDRGARRTHPDHQRHPAGGVRRAAGATPACAGSMCRWTP